MSEANILTEKIYSSKKTLGILFGHVKKQSALSIHEQQMHRSVFTFLRTFVVRR